MKILFSILLLFLMSCHGVENYLSESFPNKQPAEKKVLPHRDRADYDAVLVGILHGVDKKTSDKIITEYNDRTSKYFHDKNELEVVKDLSKTYKTPQKTIIQMILAYRILTNDPSCECNCE